MSALTLTQFERIPSMGAILGTTGCTEVLNQINKELGSSSYFGSIDDPFAAQHNYFVYNIVAPMRLIATQFKEQFKELHQPKDNNIFRPIVSVADLEEGIPECMWEAIAQHPTIKALGKQDRVDLFGLDVSLLPESNPYHRLLNNGVSTFSAQDLKDSGGTYIEEHDWRSTDPVLSVDDLEALEDTYEFLDRYYTDLDEIYEKLGKTHVIHDKSYIHDGLQLRDLDVTSFPNRKG